MARLPQVGGDAGNWGQILNDFLVQSHDTDGLLKNNIVGPGQLKANAVTAGAIANDAITGASIQDGTITEPLLSTAVQTKLNAAGGGVSSVNTYTGDVVLTKADLALGNVNNTTDANKPISSATQTALDLKLNTADLDSQTATNISTNASSTHTALANTLATVALSGSYTDLSGRPALAPVATSGVYADLTGKPTLSTVATSGSYADLSSKPVLSPVATSGAYADLSGTPALSPVATSGSYTDLTDRPGAINAQAGTTYTLILSDANKWLTLSNAAVVTLTVPANASAAFPIGTQIEGSQEGIGQVTIAPAAGVTLHAAPGLKVAAQYGVFGMKKLATDTWTVYGRLTP